MQQQQNQLTNKPSKRRFLGACSLYYVAANTGSWRLEKPVVNPEVCVRCGICVSHCPVDGQAISFANGKDKPPVYDYKKCIRCYCCQEMCPQHAIR